MSWEKQFDEEFKRGKNWDICLHWNDGKQPLIWSGEVESIKKNIIQFIKDLRKKDEEELMKIINELNDCGLTEDECGALGVNLWRVNKLIKDYYKE